MRDTRPLLLTSGFPPVSRGRLETLQVNLGYRCNQQCSHCHVNAGPSRTEMMDAPTIDLVLQFIDAHAIGLLDVTGGAPELSPHFRRLVSAARQRGVRVMDRCNLTVLLEPGQEDLADFMAQSGVEITASLPCYTAETVDGQRGKGVYQASIEGLLKLNALGYGRSPALPLNLVYNPSGPFLPPVQDALEADYRRELWTRFGIEFTHLLALANMPISRFGATLLAQGEFEPYMELLQTSHSDANLDAVMCRSLLSVDYRGYVYDCDFNQMLDLPMIVRERERPHLRDLLESDVSGQPVRVARHCFGCTAGQGSSCGGALEA